MVKEFNMCDPIIWTAIGFCLGIIVAIVEQWLNELYKSLKKRLRGGGGDSNASTPPELSGRC